jgi:hypothetical protein
MMFEVMKRFVVLIPCLSAKILTAIQYLSIPMHFLMAGGMLLTRITFNSNAEDSLSAKWARYGFSLSFILFNVKHLLDVVYIVYLMERDMKKDKKRNKIRKDRAKLYILLFNSGFCNFVGLLFLLIGYMANGSAGSVFELLYFHFLSVTVVLSGAWGLNLPFLFEEIKLLRFGKQENIAVVFYKDAVPSNNTAVPHTMRENSIQDTVKHLPQPPNYNSGNLLKRETTIAE